MNRFRLLLFALFCVTAVQARQTYEINRDWKFFTRHESDATLVNLPHTWSNDALGGNRDYYRGAGNYLKYIELKPDWRGKRLFLRFGGANLVTNVILNGKHIAEHRGGGSAFVVEITDVVDFSDRNLLWIIVNNAQRSDVMPTAGAANSYGGLYRGVELIVANTTVISPEHYASDGVSVVADKVSTDLVAGSVDVKLSSTETRLVSVETKFFDSKGECVATVSDKTRIEAGRMGAVTMPFQIEKPVLWQGPENPAMYRVDTRVYIDGHEQDRVSIETGFRRLELTDNGPVLLNGQRYPIHGVYLRRDRSLTGTAVLPSQIVEDVDIICRMGANAVYVADGPHSQEFYNLCDNRGLLVISQLPFIGASNLGNKGFFDSEEFRQNGREQLQSMVWQLRNHPSIMAWSLFSQMEIRGESPVEYIKELNALCKSIDTERLTSACSNQDGDINFITDLIIWNHTYGWDEGIPDDIAIWQEQIHSRVEWSRLHSAVAYRAGASIYQQSEKVEKPLSVGNWHPENWQTYLHERYFEHLSGDDQLWGFFAGDVFDYGSVERSYGRKVGICDWGLATFDRTIMKDAYYLYKANWNHTEPFVYIAARRCNERSEPKQQFKVYSNGNSVEMWLNGTSLGQRKGLNGTFVWNDIDVTEGTNRLKAVLLDDGSVCDSVIFHLNNEVKTL